MVKPKSILIDPKNVVNITEYWEKVCGNCPTKNLDSNGNNYNIVTIADKEFRLNIEIAEECARCHTFLSEARKDGKPFYII